MTYPLAANGVFRTIQGEGTLIGEPMVFIRLAGCSIGCPECDTDYRVAARASLEQLRSMVSQHLYGNIRWAWVTGGEPTDHDLPPIIGVLRDLGLRVAVATAGQKPVRCGFFWGGVDFLSVSPHSLGAEWVQRSGDQVNLVPGLNDLSIEEIGQADDAGAFARFPHRWITPASSMNAACLDFVLRRPGWRLGIQAHKTWGVP